MELAPGRSGLVAVASTGLFPLPLWISAAVGQHNTIKNSRNRFCKSRLEHGFIIRTKAAITSVTCPALPRSCGRKRSLVHALWYWFVFLFRRLLLVLFLQLSHFAPAQVLFGLGKIGVFFVFQPKAEPVQIALFHPPHVSRVVFHMIFVWVFNPFDLRSSLTQTQPCLSAHLPL